MTQPTLLDYAAVFGFILAIGCLIYFIIVRDFVKKPETKPFKYNKEESDGYLQQLTKMCEIYTIYKIDTEFGDNFNYHGVNETATPSNDDLIKAHTEVQEEIYKDMGTNMKSFLFNAYGEEYIRKYIRNYSLSMIMNYTDYTVKDIMNLNRR